MRITIAYNYSDNPTSLKIELALQRAVVATFTVDSQYLKEVTDEYHDRPHPL
jgi:hypothetical protein